MKYDDVSVHFKNSKRHYDGHIACIGDKNAQCGL